MKLRLVHDFGYIDHALERDRQAIVTYERMRQIRKALRGWCSLCPSGTPSVSSGLCQRHYDNHIQRSKLTAWKRHVPSSRPEGRPLGWGPREHRQQARLQRLEEYVQQRYGVQAEL